MTGNETASKMGVFRCLVKSLSTQSVLTNESEKTHLNRRCWHFCWHFCGTRLLDAIRPQACAHSRHANVSSESINRIYLLCMKGLSMRSISLTPGFQALPLGVKRLLVISESFFFEEPTTRHPGTRKPAKGLGHGSRCVPGGHQSFLGPEWLN